MRKMMVALILLMFVPTMCIAEVVANLEIVLHLPHADREGTYTGEMEDGVPHGYGCFVREDASGANSWIYVGEFEHGIFSGEGITAWLSEGGYDAGTYQDAVIVSGVKRMDDERLRWEGKFNADGTVEGKAYIYGNLFFEGTFSDNTPIEGTLYDPDTGDVMSSGVYNSDFLNLLGK